MEESQMIRDPVEQFHQWFQMAVDRCPGDWFDPTAMTLATASPDGEVTARIVLIGFRKGRRHVLHELHFTKRKTDLAESAGGAGLPLALSPASNPY